MNIGYAMGSGGRTCPTIDDYETIDLLKRQGARGRLNADEQAQAVVYLESPLGRLLCALRDTRAAAWDAGDKETPYVLDGLHCRATQRLRAVRADS